MISIHGPQGHDTRNVLSVRIGSAPCSFGVDEIAPPGAWMPEPDELLSWLADLGYQGTELGPPGYFPKGAEFRSQLARRNLGLIAAFFPLRLSYAEFADEDRQWLRNAIEIVRSASPTTSSPIAMISDGIDEPLRQRISGRVHEHPEARLSTARFETLVDNLHRAADLCLELGLEAVVHPHAGTYLETADEIHRLMERLDGSLVGLCLDTCHLRFGGGDPIEFASMYSQAIRHVHLKDCDATILQRVIDSGGSFTDAVAAGVFVDLGRGDSRVAEVLAVLRHYGYSGWMVVEQDRFLGPADTRAAIIDSQRRNMQFLRTLGL